MWVKFFCQIDQRRLIGNKSCLLKMILNFKNYLKCRVCWKHIQSCVLEGSGKYYVGSDLGGFWNLFWKLYSNPCTFSMLKHSISIAEKVRRNWSSCRYTCLLEFEKSPDFCTTKISLTIYRFITDKLKQMTFIFFASGCQHRFLGAWEQSQTQLINLKCTLCSSWSRRLLFGADKNSGLHFSFFDSTSLFVR